jgi:hypothetical protein
MQALIDDFFGKLLPRFTQSLDRLAQPVRPTDEPTSDQLVDEITQEVNTILVDCARLEKRIASDAALLKNTQARFREAVWPWFGQSWVAERSLKKPRGYPGDYELLTAIYNGVPRSSGFGGYLDRYLLNMTLARAVRGRMRAARRFLVSELNRRERDVSVLNVACGPCREYVENFVPANHRQIRLTCVDNDMEALEFVRVHVAPLIEHQIAPHFVRYNALRMTSARHNVQKFGRPDIIYSVGLCDYIADQYLVPMLRGWRESLADDGIVYVAFKDAERYDKTEYQWLLDWHFLQRTEDDCRRLFEEAGYDLAGLEATRDSTGVIINFIGRANAGVTVRVDVAESVPQAALPPPNGEQRVDRTVSWS